MLLADHPCKPNQLYAEKQMNGSLRGVLDSSTVKNTGYLYDRS